MGYKHHRPTLWRVTKPPPEQDIIAIPRAIASDPFLAHSDEDTTTASLKCDEILDKPDSSSVLAPTLQRKPIYAYQEFSYEEDNYVTSGTYKVPLVHQLNKNPDTIHWVPPSREQRMLDLLVQQTQPIKRGRPRGSTTSTLKATKRAHNERVPGPVLNLKIDGINHFKIMQKFGPNRKRLRSIVSSNLALLAQSTTDQHRANSCVRNP